MRRTIYIVAALASLSGVTLSLPAYCLTDLQVAHQAKQAPEFESDNLSAWPYQLTSDARLMAEQLELMPLINEYIQLKNQIPAPERSKNAQLQSLRQDITDIILTTMLEVQSVTAKINLEISQGDDIRNYLEDKRDKAMKYNAVANIVAGAVSNVIGVALQMPKISEMPGEIVELVGGSGQMGFGTLALMQQDGGKQRLQARPNMLAKLFDRPIAANAEYPPNIWAYVNSPVEGSKLSKRAQLIEGWKQVGLLPDPKKGSYNNQVLMLTGTASGRYHLTLDLIEDRAIMLADLRAVLSQMDSNLLELMLFMKKS